MISHSEQKKVFFEGRAGTGKTVIAKALAEEKAAQGLKVMYLCFNEELASSMKYNLQDVDVFYFHQLSRDVCEKAGIEWQIPTDYTRKEDFYNIDCNDLLLEALEELPEQRWDVVVVDEAHDLKEDWWLSVHELLKDKKKSYLWAFIDPLQDIFSRKSLEQFSLRPAPLFFNCRNTKEIAKFSYGWVDDKPHMHPESPQGEEVEDIYYKDNHDQLDKLSDLLQELLADQKVLAKDIVVLTGVSHNKSPVWKMRDSLPEGMKLTKTRGRRQRNNIYFTSIWRFKGLDSKIVIMCDLQSNLDDNVMYCGSSRAKHRLYLLNTTS